MQKDNEIIKELEQLGSPLASLPRTMPFTVPEQYFSRFAGDLNGYLQSGLADHDGAIGMPHEVPQGYFAALPAAVLDKIKAGEQPKQKTISLAGRLMRPLRFAAAAAVLMAAGLGISQLLQGNNTMQAQLDKLPDEALNEYVLETGEPVEPASQVATTVPLHTDNLTEEEIEAYLNETSWQ